MFSKISVMTALIAVVGQAMAAPSPAALEARTDYPITDYGTILTYPQANYGGSSNAVILHVIDGETPLCKIYTNINTKTRYPVIRSYVATNMTCITFPSSDCSGNANGQVLSSGLHPDVTNNAGSMFCTFSNR